ncbi:DUF882 domain-containing protein [Rhizobium sp. RU20A]|uniref:DUF882 domain-containing protein n=1 Tax=Rhizobium sp. RU20A TaxID=1907412 RepID=UPI001FCF11E1|nr:DUF882 domain-containing protein [Rhizobium sp. RU20A]
MVSPGFAPPVEAAGQTRTLKLYFVHTGEKAAITFKRNGRYDRKGLQQINRFLRDWRRNEPTNMDPRLFDLVWEVYQAAGAKDYIHVVSAYRSPATNNMLRSRSRGVAKKSQHMLGKAMDFYIPGVKLAKLRELGIRFQVGGVGYYPTSGSPFVHMDVGGVRAWPRMTRQELTRVFPDGKTMHIPSDGKPLPGYAQAVADYKKRVGANAIQVAGGGATGEGDVQKKRPGNLFAMLFGGGDEDEEPDAIAAGPGAGGDDEEAPAARAKPAPQTAVARNEALPGITATQPAVEPQTETAEALNAPVPLNRPAFRQQPVEEPGVAVALVNEQQAASQAAIAAVTAEAVPPAATAGSEFADLNEYKVPVPQARAILAGQLAAAADAETEDGLELASVPVPSLRPADETLLQSVAEMNVAVPATADRSTVAAATVAAMAPVAGTSPAQQAILAQQASAAGPRELPSQAETQVALAAPSSVMDQQPADLAAFAPVGATPAASGAFDKALNVDETQPQKRARPKKTDAEAATRSAKRTEPKLTDKIIAEWALSTGRMATLSKPVKAPRFVSRSLRAAPTTVYAAGFTSDEPVRVDTGRFSGTAVNFMEVKRFGTN